MSWILTSEGRKKLHTNEPQKREVTKVWDPPLEKGQVWSYGLTKLWIIEVREDFVRYWECDGEPPAKLNFKSYEPLKCHVDDFGGQSLVFTFPRMETNL